ncbi:hypothetical protein QFC19_004593 [Naganishia cerealis]|uniref:Uncharacterized protein n=1 Tax=Naganishia cerealis TaxID=610337 RepID=A0ACC2VTU3_9TREE|nr:hypothetical protein QFC19_004593 [Naganishia cerealis]
MAPNKKGKAGGTGKKGKKFVEDKVSRDLTMSYSTGGQDSNLSVASLTGYKSALLSLMDNIPKIQKETAREEAAIAVTLSAKGKSSSLAGDDEEIAVTSNHSDSEGLENGEGDPVKRDTPRIVKEQGKKESKNRQRTKIKNRALVTAFPPEPRDHELTSSPIPTPSCSLIRNDPFSLKQRKPRNSGGTQRNPVRPPWLLLGMMAWRWRGNRNGGLGSRFSTIAVGVRGGGGGEGMYRTLVCRPRGRPETQGYTVLQAKLFSSHWESPTLGLVWLDG